MTDYSIYPFLRTDKPKKRNNKYPVYIRVRIYRQEVRVPTNIELDAFNWDKKRRVPKEKSLKILLTNKIVGLERHLNNVLAKEQKITVSMVREYLNPQKELSANKSPSFYDYYLEYIKRREKDLNPETIRVYMTTYNVLKAFRPTVSLSDINLSFIEQFDDYMRLVNGNANGGRYPKHKNLKTVILDMIKHEIPIKNPYPFFKIPQPNVKEVYLEKGELEALRRLYAQLDDEGTALFMSLEMYLFSCYCGLRISDVVTLKWSEVDMSSGLIVKKQVKTKEEVKAPIFGYAKEILLRKSESGRLLGTNELVFGNACTQVVNRKLKDLAKMAGIKKHITFHSSRHTFATLLVMDGVSIYKIQKFLGHKSVSMTERYLKYDLNMAKVNMEEIDTFG
ncbi:site-specific integrase [Muribaculum intestinale]|uniref:site-specific integrase n=1 Tax=Muribaculum intestinale TaxID=1796646 RepID=UPI00261A5FBB|nr:site-specific integrase [Muribaculum intestinale]